MTEVKRCKTSDGQVRQGFACMFGFFSLYILHEITGRGGGLCLVNSFKGVCKFKVDVRRVINTTCYMRKFGYVEMPKTYCPMLSFWPI